MIAEARRLDRCTAKSRSHCWYYVMFIVHCIPWACSYRSNCCGDRISKHFDFTLCIEAKTTPIETAEKLAFAPGQCTCSHVAACAMSLDQTRNFCPSSATSLLTWLRSVWLFPVYSAQGGSARPAIKANATEHLLSVSRDAFVYCYEQWRNTGQSV